MNGQMILIVEDDLDIADIVATYLQAAGFMTKHLSDGNEVVGWVKSNTPALIILDIHLPGKDGLDICREVRAFSEVPIIMATAKIEEVDRLIGLEIGADDYVCKPYSVKEVVARVKANLRRFGKLANAAGKLILDSDSFCLNYQGQAVELTAIEFSLFHLLYANPSRIYSRGQIIDLVYQDYRDVSDRTVDSHIRNLRKKLSKLPLEHDFIRSIYGAGYKFEAI
ncbi:response regulator [Thalassomonas actiniarum]|uniref:Response regulator n=1 Tax=Thalassomonas actiniarum TaxID=485447 RepID=A0AAE9YXW7_9GAMM|nr:response regulator [Thalassomonas actiniarum]WDE02450.1 response regulator [Thalassomonas actiniarum]